MRILVQLNGRLALPHQFGTHMGWHALLTRVFCVQYLNAFPFFRELSREMTATGKQPKIAYKASEIS